MISICTNITCQNYYECRYGCSHEMYEGLKKFGTQKRLGNIDSPTRPAPYCFRSNLDESVIRLDGCEGGRKYWNRIKNLPRTEQVRRAMKTDYLNWLIMKGAWIPSRVEIQEIAKHNEDLAMELAPWFFPVNKIRKLEKCGGNLILASGKDKVTKQGNLFRLVCFCKTYGAGIWDIMPTYAKVDFVLSGHALSGVCSEDELLRLAKRCDRVWLYVALDMRLDKTVRLNAAKKIPTADQFRQFVGRCEYSLLNAYLERNK